MSREEKALAGVSQAIPDDTIQDVALVSPRGSTRAGAIGAALGGAIGGQLGGAGVTGAWQSLGYLAGQRRAADQAGMPGTLVLAASPSTVYALGRARLGLVGGWRDLTPLVKIERRHLRVEHRLRGVVMQIDLTDTTTGSTLKVEARLLGNLGVTDFLENLESTDTAEPE
jgi:hypothetical protein